MEENGNRIKKILFNEVSFVLSIAAMVFWLMNYINSPITKIELDIALLQKDIQTITLEHIEYTKNANERDKIIIQMGKDIERILTILEQR